MKSEASKPYEIYDIKETQKAKKSFEDSLEDGKVELFEFFVIFIKKFAIATFFAVIIVFLAWLFACIFNDTSLVKKMEEAFFVIKNNVFIPAGTFIVGYLFKPKD